MTLIEQLKQIIQRKALKYATSISGPIPLHAKGFEIGYKAGAESMLPIIEKLIEQRDDWVHLSYRNVDGAIPEKPIEKENKRLMQLIDEGEK